MTNEELEAGFQQAVNQWDTEHPTHNPDEFANNRAARYFFFAGAQFGCGVAQDIYRDVYGPDGVPKGYDDDIEGHPA